MIEHRTLTRKLVRGGAYVAEVEVTLIETGPAGTPGHKWSPYLSLGDVKKLDEVRLALRRGDLAAAARLGGVYELKPVAVK